MPSGTPNLPINTGNSGRVFVEERSHEPSHLCLLLTAASHTPWSRSKRRKIFHGVKCYIASLVWLRHAQVNISHQRPLLNIHPLLAFPSVSIFPPDLRPVFLQILLEEVLFDFLNLFHVPNLTTYPVGRNTIQGPRSFYSGKTYNIGWADKQGPSLLYDVFIAISLFCQKNLSPRSSATERHSRWQTEHYWTTFNLK